MRQSVDAMQHLTPTPPPEFSARVFYYITTGPTLLPPACLVPKSEDYTCPICRGSYFGANLESESEAADLESAIRLSCGHIFGHLCIQSWFESHYSCPLCRADVGELYSYVGTEKAFEIFLESHNKEVDSFFVVDCDVPFFPRRSCWTAEYYAAADVQWVQEDEETADEGVVAPWQGTEKGFPKQTVGEFTDMDEGYVTGYDFACKTVS